MTKSAVVHIEIGHADAVLEGLNQRSALAMTNVSNALLASLAAVGKRLEDKVPKVTRTLLRSWAQRPIRVIGGGGEAIIAFEGGWGSRLVYAPVIEFGFDGTVKAHTVRAHVRNKAFGKTFSPFVVDAYQVRAHHRVVRERPYARPALAESQGDITKYNQEAVAATAAGRRFK